MLSSKVITVIEAGQVKPDIPEFEILGRIGGGSYGEVFLGRSVTGVLRAVKVVRREDFERDKTFEREFEGIKRYEEVSRDHIGLVDVFHVGRNDEEGFYYYVMELADDCETGPDIDIENYRPHTLAEELKRRPQNTIDDCVRVGALLAGALGHLHQARLTHRDVKPSNIIFVKGMPQLADVGLVARTGQRTFVGTEGYVPPEGPGTSSADLYSLAMVLYEMATGKDRLEFPELPTNLELPPTMNRDEWRRLNSVICRAGAPDPRKRFETGQGFAAALQRVIAEEETSHSGIGKMAAAAVILLGLFAAGIYFAVDQFRPDANPGDNDPNIGTLAGNSATNGTGSDPPFNPDNANPSSNGEEPSVGTPPPDNGAKGENPDTSVASNNGSSANGVFDPFDFSGNSLSNPGASIRPFTGDHGENVVISDADSMPDQPKNSDKNGGAKSAKGTAGPNLPPPPKPMAEFKLISRPEGATVWHEGRQIGRTPTGPLQFEPGQVKLVLKAEGYHDLDVSRKLKAGRNRPVPLEMLPDRRPKPGSNWENSLGITFKSEGGLFFSENEIEVEPFEQFLDESKRPVAIASIEGAVQVSDDDALWAFCDWMTERDRKRGFLDETQYYAPQRSGTEGKTSAFFCRVDDRFGSILVKSEPAGADVYLDGELVAQTPRMIENHRAGRIQVKIGRPGFETATVSGTISPNRIGELNAELERDASVVFGEPWEKNSLAMKLVPVGELMVSVFETRVSDFAAFLESDTANLEAPAPGFRQDADHPVAGVNADDARAFCRWLTRKERNEGLIQPYHEYRLPTDLEWSEFVGLKDLPGRETPENRDSKIPDVFPWGKGVWPPPENSGNFADESASPTLRRPVIPGYNDQFPKTSPAGQFDANSFGLYDLAGNVWEWVEDGYSGPDSDLYTARGGGWNVSDRQLLLSSYRNAVSPTWGRDNIYGFRCVLADTR
ncbi:MAG: SUMF1/EgtB/PvdO family nonheme iron enzyme [Verrucomicrobiales bacterium]|nr:SUMF1/EgtB/PvdO family nonheme iron enzyme [Verrucomicrobiales bacterium]